MRMVGEGVLWLQDAGLAEYKLGHWQEARKYDEEALQAALTLPAADEIDQIANIQTNLALLLYGQGEYDAAKTYCDAAMHAAGASKDVNVVAYATFLPGLVATRQGRGPQAERPLMSARHAATRPHLRTAIQNSLAN